jgi:hypothetical protein
MPAPVKLLLVGLFPRIAAADLAAAVFAKVLVTLMALPGFARAAVSLLVPRALVALGLPILVFPAHGDYSAAALY